MTKQTRKSTVVKIPVKLSFSLWLGLGFSFSVRFRVMFWVRVLKFQYWIVPSPLLMKSKFEIQE